MQNLNNLLARRRARYSVLIGIILLTLPCYIIGAIALAIAPKDHAPQATVAPTATFLILSTINSPATSYPTVILVDTPTQFIPPSATVRRANTATFTPMPTGTLPPTAVSSSTATATLPPTLTNTPPTPPTATPTDTATPERPTDTSTPSPTPAPPTPTATPTHTPTPTPSHTPTPAKTPLPAP